MLGVAIAFEKYLCSPADVPLKAGGVGGDGGRGGGGGGHHGEGDVVDEDKEQLGGREEDHLDGR